MHRLLAIVSLVSLLSGCVSIDKERSEIDEAMWTRISVEYTTDPAIPEADAYLSGIGEHLVGFAPESPAGPTAWTFRLLECPDVQAFATIDGHVAVTLGLLELTNREDELAAILARQIAHARLQHAWGFMNNQINAAGFFIYPKGAFAEGGTRGAKVEYASWLMHREGIGFMHPFQGWQLIEADRAAMEMLAGAGYDPGAIMRTLEISATHPDSQYAHCYGHVDERRQAIEEWLAHHEDTDRPDRDDGAFEAFRRSIDAAG